MNPIRAIYIAMLASIALAALWSLSASGAIVDPALVESRYCGVQNIERDVAGKIKRRTDVILAFRNLYPCPSTGHTRGACPGWNIDHPIPISRGGCDAVSNLQWLPVEIKRCGEPYCKDRWELKVYKRRSEVM